MPDSLYKRIGGKTAIRKVVNLFYIKVLADPRISHLFEDIDMEGLIQHQYTFMMKVFGGSDIYKGRTMRAAHAHLNLTDEHFDAVAENLHATLEVMGLPDSIISEVMTIVASTRSDVLGQ